MCCIWLGWSLFSLVALTVLYIGNTPGLWLLLSRADTASVLSPQHSSPPRGWGRAKSWEGTQAGKLTQISQRDFLYNINEMKKTQMKKTKGIKGGTSLPRFRMYLFSIDT